MEAGRHSQTAVVMAAIRAVHNSGPPPRIFEDAFARVLLSRAEYESFEQMAIKMLEHLQPGVAASASDSAGLLHQALRVNAGVNVLARARYIEEALFSSLADGVRQYVIIGAGLDTFALRHPELGDRLRIIEIDHPATQALKQARLAQAGLAAPKHLQFLAADLERDSVAVVLRGTNYEASAPAFFAWPGVVPYLTSEAVLATLRSLASIAAPGSRLVFDYLEASALAPDAPMRIRLVVDQARKLGEPMMSNLNPTTLESDLTSVGFRLTEDLGPDQIQSRILANADSFQAVEYWHFVQATTSLRG